MSRATEITTSRRGDVTINSRDKQTVLFPLLISNYWTGGCCTAACELKCAWFWLFVTILQRYTSTLRIDWTRRCCFYHESKMGMTPQRLLCTLKGSGSRRLHAVFQESCEYYIQCSLYMHNMLLTRLNIRHMRNKWRVVNIYRLPPVRQFSFYRIPCSASLFQSLDVTSPPSFILA